MMRRLLLFILILVISGSNAAMSQEVKPVLVTGVFEKVSIPDFFAKLESEYNLRFYYDIRQLDSVYISLSANDEPLSQFLERALKNTTLQFTITKGNRIYITKGIRIATALPDGFFPADSLVSRKTANDSIPQFNADFRREVQITSEHKLYEIGVKTSIQQGTAIINGNVRNAKTGEPLVNTSVFIDNRYFTTTDEDGYYSLRVPKGSYTLNIVAIGMKDTKLQLAVYSDGRMDIDVQEQITTLKGVTVSSDKTINVKRVQMGVERLNIETIKRIPTVFGETDILRAITSLPGVKTVGEATTGFNVRGGSADQNLILFNDATIYNPAHFFGMFSAFNPEVVKEVELYKSSIPARFGGRLASVLDVSGREGNKRDFTGSAGIGVITSRIHIEGPLKKDRTSFIFGGRTTYANWLLGLLPKQYDNSKASFQDINLSISHRIDSVNNVYFSGYFSNDNFNLNNDTTYGYSNRNLTIKWKRNFNNKLSATFITGIDQYRYKVRSDDNKVNAFAMKFDITQLYGKADFVYYKDPHHSFDFGASTMMYKLHPGSYEPVGNASLVAKNIVEQEQALESAVYLTHRYTVNDKLSIHYGLRYSIYNYLGPGTVNYYVPGEPVTLDNVTETKAFGGGRFIQTYSGPEVRASVRYAFSNSFSIKAGYNSQRQYIHMLSNTTAIAPTDVWKLSDPNIKPQRGDQVSLGLYKNLRSNTIETSVEVYYKRIRDYLDYKPGATLLLNHAIETDVINTRGKAYGLELMIKKTSGKLNGWISYTYSRILLQSDDPDLGILVNDGKYYPANYDKPHDVTFTGSFRINHRLSISMNGTYSTGRPITLPIGRFYYGGSQRVIYSNRNEYRIPDYIRADVSINIEGNHRVRQKTHNSWTVGAYNLMGRRNPYSVYFVSENGLINGYKLSIFGNIIPFINYNIRF